MFVCGEIDSFSGYKHILLMYFNVSTLKTTRKMEILQRTEAWKTLYPDRVQQCCGKAEEGTLQLSCDPECYVPLQELLVGAVTALLALLFASVLQRHYVKNKTNKRKNPSLLFPFIFVELQNYSNSVPMQMHLLILSFEGSVFDPSLPPVLVRRGGFFKSETCRVGQIMKGFWCSSQQQMAVLSCCTA